MTRTYRQLILLDIIQISFFAMRDHFKVSGLHRGLPGMILRADILRLYLKFRDKVLRISCQITLNTLKQQTTKKFSCKQFLRE